MNIMDNFAFFTSTLIFAGAFLPAALCQIPTAEINMNGVRGNVTFQVVNSELIANIKLTLGYAQLVGTNNVDIKRIWVHYDQKDKCSDAELGETTYTTAAEFPDSQASNGVEINFGTIIETLEGLEGYSLRVHGTSMTVCATMETTGDHITASAIFSDTVYGHVFFRQLTSEASAPTRIVASLQTSHASVTSAKWAIVGDESDCSAAYDSQKIYNPQQVDHQGCSAEDDSSCPVGDLSGKVGDVAVTTLPGLNKTGYSDSNLPISGDNGIKDKFLVVSISVENSQVQYCAPIKVYNSLSAQTEFNENGVHGTFNFTQLSPFDATHVQISVSGLNRVASGYHVHEYPRPDKTSADMSPCAGEFVSAHLNPFNVDLKMNYPAPTASTDDMYEVGDLSSKYGTMAGLEAIHVDEMDYSLPLFGANSIIGRSVVIHKQEANARWICANIEPLYTHVAAVAKFRHPVIGQVVFLQQEGDPEADTHIFATLDYLYAASPSSNQWKIYANKTGSDAFSEDTAKRCQSTGDVYNPDGSLTELTEADYTTNCSVDKPWMCKQGDLSGRLGALAIRAVGKLENSAESFFTGSKIPLSGAHLVIGKSLVILSEDGNTILACATIQPLHAPMLKATFEGKDGSSVTGSVGFSQSSGFGMRKTTVTNELSGSKDRNLRLSIHELPLEPDSPDCASLGSAQNYFNPSGVKEIPNPEEMGHDLDYPIGSLERFGWSDFSTYNLPLSGPSSVMGRYLVVSDEANVTQSCAQILVSPSEDGLPQRATVTVQSTPELASGRAFLYQFLYTDGSMSDTSISLDIKREDNQSTYHHNWHVHTHPISGDHTGADVCQSAGGHFDPYKAIDNKTVYDAECKPMQPLHCEMGDQANKLDTYSLCEKSNNMTGKVFTDVDLPLGGIYSVLGRSLVFHVKERGAGRLFCEDIIPASGTPLYIILDLPATLDKPDVASKYASAIGVPSEVITLEVLSTSADNVTTANVHFSGLHRDTNRETFVTFLSDDSQRESLGDYAPRANATWSGTGNGCERRVLSPVQLMVLFFLATLWMA